MCLSIRLFGGSVADLTTAGSKLERNLLILMPCTDVLADCLCHTKMAVRPTVKPVAAHDSGLSTVRMNRTSSSTA